MFGDRISLLTGDILQCALGGFIIDRQLMSAGKAEHRLRVVTALPIEVGGRNNNADAWQTAKMTLENDLRPAVFQQWLQPSRLLHYELGHMSIVVPDARIQRYIEQRLRPVIESALNAACGGPTDLEIVIEGETPNA